VPAVDHRFALSNPALVSAPSKKLISAVRAPDLGGPRPLWCRNGRTLD